MIPYLLLLFFWFFNDFQVWKNVIKRGFLLLLLFIKICAQRATLLVNLAFSLSCKTI